MSRGLWPSWDTEWKYSWSRDELPSLPHLRQRPGNPCCLKGLGQRFSPGGNFVHSPPWRTLGDVWGHQWLLRLELLLTSGGWGPEVLLDTPQCPENSQVPMPAVLGMSGAGKPRWERPDSRGGGLRVCLGQRPDQSPSGKFSAKGASFSRSVYTSGAGIQRVGGWQPGLAMRWGQIQRRVPVELGGSAGRVGSRGCRTEPGWARLGLRVLNGE